MKADIRFGNGSIHRCIGRVVNRESVPWTDEADLRKHIAHINEKNPEAHVEIVRIIEPASADTRPEGGDSTEIEAPFTSGAVPKADAQNTSEEP